MWYETDGFQPLIYPLPLPENRITFYMDKSLYIKTISGKEIASFIPALAKLRITVFREFPYLYDGSLEYEEDYLQTYVQSEESVAVLVFDDDKIVGASTALPMGDETEEFKAPFLNGYNPEKIFYCGESVLLQKYRGRGIYSRFFDERENHAKRLNRFQWICFCAVVRENNHPLRPDDYQPLDSVWQKFGYQKHPELTTFYSWKDVGEKNESKKKMVFWLKRLSGSLAK